LAIDQVIRKSIFVGGAAWHCYAWGKGGSVFDFLRSYYGLDARELWHRIQAGARF
jgi:hypothetical protein